MIEHECIIGLYYDNTDSRLTTLNGLKYLASEREELEKVVSLDPVYAVAYHSYKRYTLSEYLDKRRNVNMKRFDFCPLCGKRIDWKEMRKQCAV